MRCGRRWRDSVSRRRRRTPIADDAPAATAGGAPTTPLDDRPDRLRLPARRRPERRCPTRARVGSRTACTASHARSTRRGSRGPTQRGPAGSWPAACIYELHVGTFTPEGTLDAAIDKLDHLVDLGVDARRAAAGQRVQRRAQLGLRRRAVVRRRRDLRRPGGVPALRRRLPRAAAWLSSRTSSTTTSDRAATTCRASARTCTTSARTRGGVDQPRRQPEVRRYIIDNALMWLRDFHVDGLRLDAVHALVDTSPKHILQRAGRGGRRAVGASSAAR